MPESEKRGPESVGPDDPGLGPTPRQEKLDAGPTVRPAGSARRADRLPEPDSRGGAEARRDDLSREETVRGRKPGDRVFNGRYELKRILGRGGMGVVWLAQDRELEHEVALKFLPEVMAYNEAAILELKRETKKALLLTHPHIVRIHGWERDAENAAVSMEYVDGRTLAALKAERENGCLEVADIREWVRQLCEALNYAHTKAKVVHRDLKPQNLMVNGKGDLKITDFGISRSLEESVSKTTRGGAGFSGTLSYMSPQQLESKPSEPSDDVYALGASIYELLTGKPPFYGGDVSRLIREVVPPSMAERRKELGVEGGEAIPAEWEAVGAACLAKEPGQRPAGAKALWAALNESHQGAKGTKEEKAEEEGGAGSSAHQQARMPALRDVEVAGVPGAGRLEPGGPAVGEIAGRRPAVREAEVRAATQHRPNRMGKWLALAAILVLAAFGAWWFGPGKKEADSSTAPKGASNVVAVPPVQVPAAGTNRLAQAPAQPDGAQVRREAEAKAKSEQEAAAKVQAHREAEERAKQEEARKAALAVGGVKFSTEPAGASVKLGQESKTSPADFAGLKPGKYPYVIELTGYETEQGEVEIAGGVDRQMPVFALVKSKGDLAVELDPASAEYEVSDAAGKALKSGTGNGEMTGLSVGQYRVKASHATLGEVTQTVEVKGKARAVAKLALPYGTLKVTSEPGGAKITQDGQNVGATPKTFSLVKPGRVSLRLELDGFKADTVTGTVADGRTLELAGKLEPAGPKAGETMGLARKLESASRRVGEAEKNALGMELVWIAPGRFTMGSPASEKDRDTDEGPQTRVTLTEGYWLGKYEVTQGEYEAVMGSNPSWYKGARLPVEAVSWTEAVEFCRKLTERERNSGKLPAGYEYRLPTEAQWEYACRAGTTTRFSGGDADSRLWDLGWYIDNSGNQARQRPDTWKVNNDSQTHPVGQKRPNVWGLYDMHGNVLEWCSDWAGDYPGGSVTDPTGASSGSDRVRRGGSWLDAAGSCRSARRDWGSPQSSNNDMGFRAALAPLE